MKKGILIDTENSVFKINDEDLSDYNELSIDFKDGEWSMKATKIFSINKSELVMKNDNR